MNAKDAVAARVDRLVDGYGDGADGTSPTREQWTRLLQRAPGTPTTLVNLFKLRDHAAPAEQDAQAPRTGQEAFGAYSATSIPALAKVGGEFLTVAPFDATLVGGDEDWDLVAVGTYPDVEALLRLFEDPAYRAAWAHRVAACASQRVYVIG